MSTNNGAPPTDYHPAEIIPSSLESETAVLGSCLLNPEAIYEAAVLVRPSDFFRERNAWVFEAMLALNEQREPIDIVLLQEELERRGRLAELGPTYLTNLVAATPSALYANHYARIVAQTALRRRLIAAAGEIARLAYDEANATGMLLDEAQELLFGVGADTDNKALEHVAEVTRKTINFMGHVQDGGRPPGVPSGYTGIDMMLGGFQRGDLVTLAARPSMGKSSLALGLAYNAAKLVGAHVAVFSLEMSREQVVQRWLSLIGGVDSTHLRTGLNEPEWVSVVDAANRLAPLNIWIDDASSPTITDIRTKARRVWAQHGLDLIVVDYLQLMKGTDKSENNHLEVSAISKGLKALARELNVPVIALSQLNRGVEARADKRPMLSDLRASGAIEEDSDVVMFIYREDYYIPDTDRQNIADVIIAKHRNGATGTVSLFFRKELTKFSDLTLERTELNP